LTEKAETFWDRLQEAFNQANAPAIARKLNVEKQTVYKWRKTMPSLETLMAISRSTGRSLHWLVFGEGPKIVVDATVIAELSTRAKISDRDREILQSLIETLQRGLENEK
jgi:hypothetical protein